MRCESRGLGQPAEDSLRAGSVPWWFDPELPLGAIVGTADRVPEREAGQKQRIQLYEDALRRGEPFPPLRVYAVEPEADSRALGPAQWTETTVRWPEVASQGAGDCYILADGRDRLQAALLRGMRTFPAFVLGPLRRLTPHAVRVSRWFHGGIPGLRPGDRIITSAASGNVNAGLDYLGRVFLSWDMEIALSYASAYASTHTGDGTVYEVRPRGRMEYSPTNRELTAEFAEVVAVTAFERVTASERGHRWPWGALIPDAVLQDWSIAWGSAASPQAACDSSTGCA
jgi:hypothetical protein